MMQIISLLLTVPALVAAWFVATDTFNLSLIETLVAVTLIIGAIGGPTCVQAFDTASSLFMK